MVHISSCRGSTIPERPDMSNSFTNQQHFFVGESISTHDVAIPARRDDVCDYMPDGVINSVASDVVVGAAVNAGTGGYQLEDEVSRKVADHPFLLVDAVVGFQEKSSPSRMRRCPSSLSSAKDYFLFWGQVCIPFWSSVATFLSFMVARLALIGYTERSRLFFVEKLGRCWEGLFAHKTGASGVGIGSHVHIIQYGPHFQLPWKHYP